MPVMETITKVHIIVITSSRQYKWHYHKHPNTLSQTSDWWLQVN